MKVKKLLEVIDASAAVFEVAGDAELVAAMQELAAALKPRGGLELAFVTEVLGDRGNGVSDRLSMALRGIARLQKLSGAKKFATDFDMLAEQSYDRSLVERINNFDLVDYFSNKLVAADLNLPAVTQLIKVMASAGMLAPKEAGAVAARYTKSPASYKNKKAALDAIRDQAARDAGLESKSRQSV